MVILVALAAGCTDSHDFLGRWRGVQVGDAAVLQVGVTHKAPASLDVDDIDTHGLRGRLSVDGLTEGAAVRSIPGAEADVLAGVTFDGAPLRVYFAFVPIADGGGDATAVIALFEQRIDVRLLRGGTKPIYAIFSLADRSTP